MKPFRRSAQVAVQKAGFTLAEAAITIAIVALVLMAVLQSMEGSKLSAYHTRQTKVAYEMGIGMYGEITAGLWREEMESGMTGSFAERDEPDFFWELALGEDVFDEQSDSGDERPFDNFAARREWKEDNRSDTEEFEDDEEEAEEPFEKIRIRITFPAMKDFKNELVLEGWAPWKEIYGPSEEDIAEAEAEAAGADNPAPGGDGSGRGGNVTESADGTLTATGGNGR